LLVLAAFTTMDTTRSEKIQENALYKKLLATTWATAPHHINSEYRIKSNINPH